MSPLPRTPLRTLPFAWIVIHSPGPVPAAEIEPSLVTLPVAPATRFRSPGNVPTMQHAVTRPASTLKIRLTVWFVRPPTFASVGCATTPASSSTVMPYRLPVFSTSKLLPATRMYFAGVFVTRSPLIAPAIDTLPVDGIVPYERYEVPRKGGFGTNQPLFADELVERRRVVDVGADQADAGRRDDARTRAHDDAVGVGDEDRRRESG